MAKFVKEHLPRFALLTLLASCVYALIFVTFGVLKTEGIRQTVTACLFGVGISFVFCLLMAGLLIALIATERYRSDLADFLRDLIAYVVCMTGGALLTHLAVIASVAINHATSGAVPTLELAVGWGWQIFASFMYCGLFMSVASLGHYDYDFNQLFGDSC